MDYLLSKLQWWHYASFVLFWVMLVFQLQERAKESPRWLRVALFDLEAVLWGLMAYGIAWFFADSIFAVIVGMWVSVFVAACSDETKELFHQEPNRLYLGGKVESIGLGRLRLRRSRQAKPDQPDH